MFLHPLKNNRGIALIFMVLLFTAAATASVLFISLGVKIKGIQKEGATQQRLAEIRMALQNYYLIHYDLPDPSLTTPVNSVPTVLLNLPQKYRFDSNGQMIWYDRLPANGHMTTVRNIHVHGDSTLPLLVYDQSLAAAVLVAPGPDKQIAATNQGEPYDDPSSPANDDLVVGVPLEAEALKIAYHTVAVLQQAAKAYDSIFYNRNNDADTLFLPPVDALDASLSAPFWTPGTEWYDYTPPVQERATFVCGAANSGVWESSGNCYTNVGSITLSDGTVILNGTCIRTDVSGSNIWHPNYAGQPRYRSCGSGNVYLDGTTVRLDDEDVVPRPITAGHPVPPVTDADMRSLEPPVPLIDEGVIVGAGYNSYIEAVPNLYNPGPGQGCIWFGVLANDPSRGTASMDNCSSGTPAFDLAVASGLNLIKVGYNHDVLNPTLYDPWGNAYQWGNPNSIYPASPDPLQPDLDTDGDYDQDDDALRDLHYWSFYSLGPDGLPALGPDGRPGTGDENTPDDILPADDRIDGYYTTPQISNPIP